MSNKKLIYINSYNALDGLQLTEKVLIDNAESNVLIKTENIWNELEKELRRIKNLEKVGSRISNIMHREIPFKGFNSTKEFFENIDTIDIMEFSNRYLLKHPKEKPKRLSQLILTKDLNCVGQAALLNIVSDNNWQMYNETYKNKFGHQLRDAHCIIAKRFGNDYLIIDPTNGPLKEKRGGQIYQIPKKIFFKKYIQSTFITE